MDWNEKQNDFFLCRILSTRLRTFRVSLNFYSRCQILSNQPGPSDTSFTHSIILTRQKSTRISTIMFAIAPNIIINAAKSMVNLLQKRNDTFNRRWKSSFGAPPEVCCVLWNKIDPYKTMPAGVNPKHILWALLFLTVYDTEHNSAQRLGNVSKKTYRKWSELFVIAISYLECEVVSTHPDNAIPHCEYCTLAN